MYVRVGDIGLGKRGMQRRSVLSDCPDRNKKNIPLSAITLVQINYIIETKTYLFFYTILLLQILTQPLFIHQYFSV